MHLNIKDVEGVEVAPGVTERLLLDVEASNPDRLVVKHYVLTEGEVVFEQDKTEYQHYIISGCARMGGKLVHSETAIFVPASTRWGDTPRHSIAQAGEGELRFITAEYHLPRRGFRWAKTRSNNLARVRPSVGTIANQQLFTEEQHALMGALRMHAIDIQTHAPLTDNPTHKNPEEIMYILRGKGEAVSGDERFKVSPGSFIYTAEGDDHGVFNTNEKLPLQYFVLEFIEHDKMWSERAYRG